MASVDHQSNLPSYLDIMQKVKLLNVIRGAPGATLANYAQPLKETTYPPICLHSTLWPAKAAPNNPNNNECKSSVRKWLQSRGTRLDEGEELREGHGLQRHTSSHLVLPLGNGRPASHGLAAPITGLCEKHVNLTRFLHAKLSHLISSGRQCTISPLWQPSTQPSQDPAAMQTLLATILMRHNFCANACTICKLHVVGQASPVSLPGFTFVLNQQEQFLMMVHHCGMLWCNVTNSSMREEDNGEDNEMSLLQDEAEHNAPLRIVCGGCPIEEWWRLTNMGMGTPECTQGACGCMPQVHQEAGRHALDMLAWLVWP
ncbi:hypothetical protein BDZ97DRAFT_1762247 [Flammula alnicola]|nr:hypothetical protein BDZ97DRAFT_1762247 [Flammula alnicola]